MVEIFDKVVMITTAAPNQLISNQFRQSVFSLSVCVCVSVVPAAGGGGRDRRRSLPWPLQG